MKFLKLSEIPEQIQNLFKGHQNRFTFWVRMVRGEERYYAKDGLGTDVFAYRDGRWTCITNR